MVKKRIGITMRTIANAEYPELRDAIAHDWYAFLKFCDFDADWILLPNLGRDICSYLHNLEVDSFILTGGNDIGQSPERDLTESTVLQFAVQRKRPVLGICRGMQMIHSHFGGKLADIANRAHIAKDHKVIFCADIIEPFVLGFEFTVNSFHGQGITNESLTPEFKPVAMTDNWVECFLHQKLPIAGVMWHPERSKPFADNEKKLIWHFLSGGPA